MTKLPTVQLGMNLQEDSDTLKGFCTSFLHRYIYDAMTVDTSANLMRSLMAMSDLQRQCSRHIYTLSTLEEIHRLHAETIEFEIDEMAYSEMIGFLSGLGVCLSEVADRLEGTERFSELVLDSYSKDEAAAVA